MPNTFCDRLIIAMTSIQVGTVPLDGSVETSFVINPDDHILIPEGIHFNFGHKMIFNGLGFDFDMGKGFPLTVTVTVVGKKFKPGDTSISPNLFREENEGQLTRRYYNLPIRVKMTFPKVKGEITPNPLFTDIHILFNILY